MGITSQSTRVVCLGLCVGFGFVGACAIINGGDDAGAGVDAGVVGPAARDIVYDDTCAVDADCIIGAYAACFCGSCGDIAMNASEQARFNDDNVVSGCPEGPGPACGACAPVRAVCQEGSCVLELCPNEDCDA